MAYTLYFVKSPYNNHKPYLVSVMRDLLKEYKVNLDLEVLCPEINKEFKDLYNIVLWDNFVLFDSEVKYKLKNGIKIERDEINICCGKLVYTYIYLFSVRAFKPIPSKEPLYEGFCQEKQIENPTEKYRPWIEANLLKCKLL